MGSGHTREAPAYPPSQALPGSLLSSQVWVAPLALRGLQSRVSDSAMIDKPEPRRFPPPWIAGLVAGEQLGCRASAGLLLEIDVGKRLPTGVADDEAGVRLFSDPRRREAAGSVTRPNNALRS